MELHLYYTQVGKRGSLVVEGALVIYSLARWKEVVLEKAKEIEILTANCSKLEQLDSAGLQILISTKKFFYKAGKKFIITNHSTQLLEYLDIYGLIGYFEDKVQITAKDKENFSFQYGLKRLPRILKI